MKQRLTAILIVCCLVCITLVLPAYAAKGTTYYVSVAGVSGNDGLSPEKPLTLASANSKILMGGDAVLFKRGDVFYGSFKPNSMSTSESAVLTIDAYGNGAKPILSLAKLAGDHWEQEGEFYKYKIGAGGTYGGVQNTEANVGFVQDSSGNKWPIRKGSRAECKSQYDFYCDTNYIYVKTSQNPYKVKGELILPVNGQIVSVKSHTVVRNLHIRYTGGHGLNQAGEGQRNIKVTDCVIEDCGGAILYGEGANAVRYGNAAEFYGSAYDILLERNIFRNSYDVAFTVQGGLACSWSNINVRNNIFAYNTQSCEVWADGASSGKGVKSLNFTNNVCINQGEGWGTLGRLTPENNGSGQNVRTDILFYGYNAPLLNMTIKNNTFYNVSGDNRVISISVMGRTFYDSVTSDYNHIYLPNKNSIFLGSDNASRNMGLLDLTFSDWQTIRNQDVHSTFKETGKESGGIDKELRTSLDYNNLLGKIKASGIVVETSSEPPGESRTDNGVSKNGASKNNGGGTASAASLSPPSNPGSSKNADSIGQTKDDVSVDMSAHVSSANTAKDNQSGSAWIVLTVIAVLFMVVSTGLVIYFLLKNSADRAHNVKKE